MAHPLADHLLGIDAMLPREARREVLSSDALVGVHVLVVDDDDDTRELVRTILEYAGALVTLAAGAPAALEVVARLSPDVILSDIAMPGADGYALLHQVRASTPEQAPRIPAIAVTAHGRVHGPERTRAAGFDAHLRKPIDPWELCRTVAGLARPRA
jgi:CheY-like chemotaxis protein